MDAVSTATFVTVYHRRVYVYSRIPSRSVVRVLFSFLLSDLKLNQADYKSVWGAGFSIAPILSQSAYFRYHNKDPEISNLFFVGAGTHPGAGVPGVLSSAKVTERLIMEKGLKVIDENVSRMIPKMRFKSKMVMMTKKRRSKK